MISLLLIWSKMNQLNNHFINKVPAAPGPNSHWNWAWIAQNNNIRINYDDIIQNQPYRWQDLFNDNQ